MQNDSIKIALVNPNQKVWFIRANSGIYARHFKSANLIAISHLEDIFDGKIGDKIPGEDELKGALLTNDKYSQFKQDKNNRDIKVLNRKGHQLLGQTRRFVSDIQQGDLIVTKNEGGGYNIGLCTDSAAYIDHEPIESAVPKEAQVTAQDKLALKYKLRKHVTWGPSVGADDLPGAVKKATRGQHTITNLSPHKEKVFHLIYPFFTDGESLFFSSKIKRKEKIGALVIGNLFQNVSLAENLITQLVSNKKISEELLLQLTKRNIFDQDSAVTCQAAFMSPGDIWCKIPLLDNEEFIGQIFAGLLAFLLLTGQAEAIQFDPMLANPDTISISVKREETDPDSIFTDKLKNAEASPLLRQIAKKTKENRDTFINIERDRHTKEISNNLSLRVTESRTSKLESFEFGINVIEITNKK